jgi:hypothetical protein
MMKKTSELSLLDSESKAPMDFATLGSASSFEFEEKSFNDIYNGLNSKQKKFALKVMENM